MAATITKPRVAAALAALVVLAVVVVLVVVQRPGAAREVPPPPFLDAESACGLRGTPGEGTEGAEAATWEAVGAVMLPVSATDGPGQRVASGPWSCYTRTPSGAVLAGITIALRADGMAENWQDVVRSQTVPGVGQDVKLAGSVPSAEQVTLRGFRVAGYSMDRATISYYLHTPSIDASCTAQVVWLNGDWRLQLGDDGSTSSGCSQGVPDSFTPWGP